MPFRELLVQNENTIYTLNISVLNVQHLVFAEKHNRECPVPYGRTSYVLQLSFYMIYWPACDGIIG